MPKQYRPHKHINNIEYALGGAVDAPGEGEGRAREFHESGFRISSEQFLRGFVVSANLRKTSTAIAQKNIKTLAREIPYIIYIYIYICTH